MRICMKTFKILTAVLFVVFLTACTKDPELGVGGGELIDRNISISFEDEAMSRAELKGQDTGSDHIDRVWFYIFEGDDATAVCKSIRPLEWTKGNHAATYDIKAQLARNAFYTFVAVAWETTSAYGFPQDLAPGMKLGDLVARVGSADKAQMAKSDLFACSLTKNVGVNSHIDLHMKLRRKVAGVLAYLRNIPYSISTAGGEVVVEKVRVMLNTSQNTVFPIWKASPTTDVFGSEPLVGDDKCLFEWNMTGYGHDGKTYTSDAVYDETGEKIQLENTLLSGAFLLPIADFGSDTDNTLKIDLVGKDLILKTFKVANHGRLHFPIRENRLYSIGSKISPKSVEMDNPADLSGNILEMEIRDWDSVYYQDDFVSVNGVAHFISDINPEKYIFDAPGTAFEILVHNSNPKAEWTLMINYGQYTDDNGVVHYAGNETFGQTTQTMTQDELKAASLTDWIHVADVDAEGKFTRCTNTIVDSEGDSRVLKVVLDDYAVKRDLDYYTDLVDSSQDVSTPDGKGLRKEEHIKQFMNDYRTAYLELRTKGSDKVIRFRIRQYNTITFALTQYESGSPFRGASRLDYGWQFNGQTGKPEIVQGVDYVSTEIEWGFHNSFNISFAGQGVMDSYNGEANFIMTRNKCQNTNNKNLRLGYKTCAIKLVESERIDYNTYIENGQEKVVNDRIDRHWYLPAYYEMWGLSSYMINSPGGSDGDLCLELYHMNRNDIYWVSTGDFGDSSNSYIVYIGQNEQEYNERKTQLHKTRIICNFE